MATFVAFVTTLVLLMPFISEGETLKKRLIIPIFSLDIVDGRKCYQCEWTKGHDTCLGFTSATPQPTCSDTDYCLSIYGKVNGDKVSVHQCDDMPNKWIQERNCLKMQNLTIKSHLRKSSFLESSYACSTFGDGCTKLPDQTMPDGSSVKDMQVCCCKSDLSDKIQNIHVLNVR